MFGIWRNLEIGSQSSPSSKRDTWMMREVYDLNKEKTRRLILCSSYLIWQSNDVEIISQKDYLVSLILSINRTKEPHLHKFDSRMNFLLTLVLYLCPCNQSPEKNCSEEKFRCFVTWFSVAKGLALVGPHELGQDTGSSCLWWKMAVYLRTGQNHKGRK